MFGIERFYTCIYGARETMESDHNPLENIVKKDLAKVPPRLQRVTPTATVWIADFLS